MKLDETIRILNDAGVEFVIIGGVAMGLQGSAHLTRDLAFCYARTVKNMERLAAALAPYHPALRGAPPGLSFQFDAKAIASGPLHIEHGSGRSRFHRRSIWPRLLSRGPGGIRYKRY